MDDHSVHKTGIVWIDSEPKEGHVFNEPWMDRIDNDLLFRYWKKKGCPGYLYTYVYGVKMWHREIEGAGIISFVNMPQW